MKISGRLEEVSDKNDVANNLHLTLLKLYVTKEASCFKYIQIQKSLMPLLSLC